MKSLTDVLPVLLFFVVYWLGERNPETALDLTNHYLGFFMAGGVVIGDHAPLLLATATAIIVALVEVGLKLAARKPISATLWLTTGIIVFFGGLTIYFNNDIFIKLKPTVLYWCFAATLLVSRLFFKKNAIRTMAMNEVSLPEHVWNKIDVSWMIFFLCMGILNLFVAFVLFKDNNSAWVNFKLACVGITVVFAVVQGLYLAKYLEEPK